MEANSRQVGGNHYLSPIQHWDYIVANDIPYLEAQVIKYLTRWRKKNGLEDVYKAQHYLQKLIEVEEAKAKPETEEQVKNRWLDAVGPVKQKIVDTNNEAVEITTPKPEEKK